MNVYSSISDHDVTRASVDNPSVSVEIYSPGPVGHSGPRHANGPINSLMEHYTLTHIAAIAAIKEVLREN